MSSADHFDSVLRTGSAAQARRCISEIVPDEHPTFTRPRSPELYDTQTHLHHFSKKKRTNAWPGRRDSTSESGDDCDQPLSTRLSRRASSVLSIFSLNRKRSSASGSTAKGASMSSDQLPMLSSRRRSSSAERRRSSLQKLKELITGRRRDSANAAPAASPDSDDQSPVQDRTPSGPEIAQLSTSEDPFLTYMTGALEAHASERSRNRSRVSVNIIDKPEIIYSQPSVTSAGSDCSESSTWVDASPPTPTAETNAEAGIPYSPHRWRNLNGYSPPPTPKRDRSRRTSSNEAQNLTPIQRELTRPRSHNIPAPRRVVLVPDLEDESTLREVDEHARQIPTATPSPPPFDSLPCNNAIILSPIPLLARPVSANPSIIALHTPSRPHTPPRDSPPSPAITPSASMTYTPFVSDLALPPPQMRPEYEEASERSSIVHLAHCMHGHRVYIYESRSAEDESPRRDETEGDAQADETRPSTSGTEADTQSVRDELRLRRASSLAREGYEVVEKEMLAVEQRGGTRVRWKGMDYGEGVGGCCRK